MTNRKKALLVGSLRPSWALKDLLAGVGLGKSSYYFQVGAIAAAGKRRITRIMREERLVARRRKRRRGRIPGAKPISERPAAAESRSRPGDWEGDTVVGLRPAPASSLLMFTKKWSE